MLRQRLGNAALGQVLRDLQRDAILRKPFGEGAKLDSLPDPPPRARVLGPFRNEAIAEELYGDPAAPLQFAPGETGVVSVDLERLRPKWKGLFEDEKKQRNTWPFPGFTPAEIERYVDQHADGIAVNLMTGRLVLTLDGGARTLEVPLTWVDQQDANVLPILPVEGSRDAAVGLEAKAGAFREGGYLPIYFYQDGALIWPTRITPQTTPRIMAVYPLALEEARAGARATADAFTDLLFWYVGARGIGGLKPRPPARTGRLIVASGRNLSSSELQIAGKLVSEGKTVKALAESTRQGVRTADFLVDGVKTELKSISNLTGKDLSASLNRRILEGAGQAPHIIADVRQQAGMTRELAERAIRRAFGADKLARIKLIRIIGDGFDIVVPRF